MRASNGRYERFMTSNQIGDLHLGLFPYKAKDKCIYMLHRKEEQKATL